MPQKRHVSSGWQVSIGRSMSISGCCQHGHSPSMLLGSLTATCGLPLAVLEALGRDDLQLRCCMSRARAR